MQDLIEAVADIQNRLKAHNAANGHIGLLHDATDLVGAFKHMLVTAKGTPGVEIDFHHLSSGEQAIARAALRALGAPGDWGYSTKMGKALSKTLNWQVP